MKLLYQCSVTSLVQSLRDVRGVLEAVRASGLTRGYSFGHSSNELKKIVSTIRGYEWWLKKTWTG